VWGDSEEAAPFENIDEANEILGLIMRHWNGIAATLREGGVHLPILLEDDGGAPHGNDWARGFIRGTEMRRAEWARLLNDEEHGGCMIPAMMLYHEHDDDPELRSPPIGPEKREEIVVAMAIGVVQAYRYFRGARHARQGRRPGPARGKREGMRLVPAVPGRNISGAVGAWRFTEIAARFGGRRGDYSRGRSTSV